MARSTDLFAAAGPDHQVHPNFRALRDSVLHVDVRAYMNALYSHMGDPNGNYRGDFQRDGFHARVFELACFAYLQGAGFSIDRSFERPDFVATLGDITVALEATTANPPAGNDPDLSILLMKQIPEDELSSKVYEEFPRRMLSTLRKKLKQRYQSLPQCTGRPLILVVAPFFEPGSILYTDEALLPCLYGLRAAGVPEFSDTPFFWEREAEHIAAVVYCNQFTVPRFLRLAPRSAASPKFQAIRKGVCYVDVSGSEFAIQDYRHDLNDPSTPGEQWSQGVTIFYNPGAKVPLPSNVLPCTSTLCVTDGRLFREVFGFHPVTSMMFVHTGGEHGASAR